MKNIWLALAGCLALASAASAQSPASDWARAGDVKVLVSGFRDARAAVFVSAAKAPAGKTWAVLRLDPACVLATVADMMGIALRSDIPAPALRLENDTPLKRFQDAVEPQWKMRPDMFLNAYTPGTNEVFLMADASYYNKLKRFLDDSLAHEYVHFFQVKYKNFPIDQFSDAEEGEAISYQTRFRDEYLTPGIVPPRCR
ncbi:MAG: hypothetical protein HZB91_03440 [Elusimicrobia bacterium]|nr:hypothetical protein [Elusimicrobiota bacterium]MBI5882141.1 hypothetical protein [Elusimicrobiota bacterium]